MKSKTKKRQTKKRSKNETLKKIKKTAKNHGNDGEMLLALLKSGRIEVC